MWLETDTAQEFDYELFVEHDGSEEGLHRKAHSTPVTTMT
jgi:hypothetical protein